MSSSLFGDDWPTYGGPNRTHTTTEQGLRTEWNSEEPRTLWKLDVGLGYSSVVEYKGKALTQGYQDGKNTLFCVNAKDGKILWKHQYPCKKADDYFQGGSRATPTVFEDRVFIQSHEGDVYSLDLETGKILWSLNVVKDLQGERPSWGFAGAPLLLDGKMILQTGGEKGSLAALNSSNGKVIWQRGSDGAGYASPFQRGSNPNEIVVFNQFGLALHRLSDGCLLYTLTLPTTLLV